MYTSTPTESTAPTLLLIAGLIACATACVDVAPRSPLPPISCDATCVNGLPDAATAPRLEAPATLALPYMEAGAGPRPGALLARLTGATAEEPLEVETDGPFVVEGAAAAESGRARLTVRFIGSIDAPGLHAGAARLSWGGALTEVSLLAVVGDPQLPDEVTWTRRDGYQIASPRLPASPIPFNPVTLVVPEGAGAREEGMGLVVHTHGLNASVPSVLKRQQLAELFAASGRDAVLVIPQGGANNNFGALYTPGGLQRLLRDVVALLYRDGRAARPAVGPVVLSAHSAGYRAVAEVLDQGAIAPRAVLLFDALYGREVPFTRYVAEGGVLRSLHTPGGLRTWWHNRRLRERLRAGGVSVSAQFDDDALLKERVIISPSGLSHEGCLRGERNFQRAVAASGLPPRPGAPLELLAALSDGAAGAHVRWRPDPGAAAGARVEVQGSDDGRTWRPLAEAPLAVGEARVERLPWLRLARLEGGEARVASDRYGATGRRWLVVDGFDRAIGGGWRAPTHDFAAALGQALGEPFSTASNEAVAAGLVDLEAFPRVLWLLGDEGEEDVTFSEGEREVIEAYLRSGGQLVVSGSDVGFATDDHWMSQTLHVDSQGGHPIARRVDGRPLGAAYPEVQPDVLSGGDAVLMSYDRGGAAAIGWQHRILVVGFGLENLPPASRPEVLAELRRWLDLRGAAAGF